MTCKHGHPIETDNQVYIDKYRHRRCRTCHLAKMSAYHAIHRGAYHGERRGSLQPWKYKNWAEQTWNEMTDWDRFIVVHGLKAFADTRERQPA